MSQLDPGATYVYERANGCIYARKIGDTKNLFGHKMIITQIGSDIVGTANSDNIMIFQKQ